MTKHSQAAAETMDLNAFSIAPSQAETLSPLLVHQVDRLLRKGAGKFDGVDPFLDPDAILRILAQLCRWVERSRDRDDTPLLQQVPDPVTAEPLDVTWLEVFAVLSEHTKREMAHGVTWVPRPDDVMLLSHAISEALDLVERVKTGIDGTGVEAEEMGAIRERIIGNRTISRSRSGMRLELGYLLVGINESPDAPPGLRVLTSAIRTTKRRLAIAVEGKRLPTQMKQYGEGVHVAVFALLLAMNEFLSWAAGTATMPRLRTFRRIIAPRHRADGTPVHRLDPDAPAEEGEEIDPPPSEGEEDDAPEPGLPESDVKVEPAEMG